MGSFVAHKHAKKVYRIDHHIAMTIAGVVGDAQAIVEMLRANSALYRLDLARPIPINSAARLVSNVLFQSRYYPMGVQALIGGVDDSGGHIFMLDPLGSMMEEKFVSTGSGSSASGDSFDVALITKDGGYRELTEDEKKHILHA